MHVQEEAGTFWMNIGLYIALGLITTGLVHFIVSLIIMRWRSAKQVKGFPGPASHWLKGNIDDITFDGRGLAFHLKCASTYKTSYRVWFGPLRSALILCHPDTAGVVLSKNSPKERFFYKFLYPFLGNGLGLQEGQEWENTRKLLTPSFHFKILLRYFPVFQESAQVLLDKWSRSNGKVELFQDISLLTLDSILKCAFSYSSSCQTQKIQDEYIASINGIAKALLDRLLNPVYHFDCIYNLTSAKRKFIKYCDIIHRESDKVIINRRQSLNNKFRVNGYTEQRYLDFLDILLEAKDENGKGLTDDQIRAQVNTFMFAGHDTVASALCWTLYSLAVNEKHQKLCQQEIDEAFNNNENITWEGIASLPYLFRCIKESMRLYAPVPVIARTLDETYNIDGVDVPEGTFVLANIYAMHRNPHVWENPEEFNPDRFLPEKCKARSPYAFIPFSAGPRICIGKNFGLEEIKTTVVMVLQKFDLSVDPEDRIDDLDLFPELVLRSKSGLRINIKPRDLSRR